MTFKDVATETSHPIRLYARYIEKIFLVFKFDEEESRELV